MGGRYGRVPPLRRGSASVVIVVCVFALVVLTRWHPFLLGGPSVVLLAAVSATLSPPRRNRSAARRARSRSAAPYSSVRRWDAARESLAHLPDAEIPPDGGPPTLPGAYHPGDPYASPGAGPGNGGDPYGDPYREGPYGGDLSGGREGARERFGPAGGSDAEGDEGDEGVAEPISGEAAEHRPRRPWSMTGDRPLVRVLDPSGDAGDSETTMAIDMRPLLEETELLEQTMAIDIRGFLNDPGYGRG
jgi:hypothetical protein